MFDSMTTFFIQGLIKFVNKLPTNPFSLDANFLSQYDTICGYINYFVPFYNLSTLFQTWLTLVSACASVFIIIKFILRKAVG